jgi:hypothetical protein
MPAIHNTVPTNAFFQKFYGPLQRDNQGRTTDTPFARYMQMVISKANNAALLKDLADLQWSLEGIPPTVVPPTPEDAKKIITDGINLFFAKYKLTFDPVLANWPIKRVVIVSKTPTPKKPDAPVVETPTITTTPASSWLSRNWWIPITTIVGVGALIVYFVRVRKSSQSSQSKEF